MTAFLRLLSDKDKATNLLNSCSAFRAGKADSRVFHFNPESFWAVPGAPFAYWVSESQRKPFERLPKFDGEDRSIRVGLQTGDDFRFVRTWWEVNSDDETWPGFAKGGAFSPYYADIYLVVNWARDGLEIKNFVDISSGKLNSRPQNTDFYRRPGLTWSDRTTLRLSPRPMPANVVFSVKGSAGFFPNAELSALAIMNSEAFAWLISLMVGAGDAAAKSYQVGTIGQVPFPGTSEVLSQLARRAWELKRQVDTVEETSHAYTLPFALLKRLEGFDRAVIEAELARIQSEIDVIAFDLYGFTHVDRTAMQAVQETESRGEQDDEDNVEPVAEIDGLLSWAVGVAFGLFDWRIATKERIVPPVPEPFDPLPAKSPGMLPDGAIPFYQHAGILVDDLGHSHDLACVVDQVLETVDALVTEDVRRWLQKDFFDFHLKHYSKSRRKAPIYWPLSTASGSYTLWLYYPSLSDQTLFTAVNDFVDPKLEDVRREQQTLRDKGAGRSKQDERSLEALASLEHELADLRDSLLEIAPNYRPNHDDGVQITAAPLWKLFRHKPWQKVLKDTWAKLEKGDYDWAHLAMNYWPDRVRDKCVTDKSLAIAHNLEHLYVEPEIAPKKARGRAKKQDV